VHQNVVITEIVEARVLVRELLEKRFRHEEVCSYFIRSTNSSDDQFGPSIRTVNLDRRAPSRGFWWIGHLIGDHRRTATPGRGRPSVHAWPNW
jgi:hypothetical protein